MRVGCVLFLSGSMLFAASGISQEVAPTKPVMVRGDESPSQPGLQAHIAQLFAKGDYDTIDQIADRARAEKTRLRGGIWSLKHIYNGLCMPTENGYEASAHNPQSVTARVGLAEVYYRYGWESGDPRSESASPDAKKLFTDRLGKAQTGLDDAATLKVQCPESYWLRLAIARSEGWDNAKTAQLYAKAVAFEPGYFYYYDSYADYLLPSWNGKPQASAVFAQQAANNVGGQLGDFIYFEMSAHIAGDMNLDPNELDWTRIQRGHQALADMYDSVNYDRNQFALLAWRFKDAAVARQEFGLIGNKWARTIWSDEAQYDSARQWAGQRGVASPVSLVR
jgi:hypothetical protein